MQVYQMKGETNQMEEDINFQYQKEREQLEHLTNLFIDKILFDSNFDNWK